MKTTKQIITALEKENEKLRKALKPFADEADQWWHKISDGYRPGVTEPRNKCSYSKAVFSIGDLRRAERLLRTKAAAE